ncbi:MAG: serine/threonine protein kinase [Elusimicrobia bacterium]|nr:serine/threonine protein kinase [Elusimicrobiota bacterium]
MPTSSPSTRWSATPARPTWPSSSSTARVWPRSSPNAACPGPRPSGYSRTCCAALRYAHEKRIVHRDLKPANVMVARDGTVKVMDFGIAYTAQKSISRLTRAAAWGTPPYMAPEQELGGVSAGVDLFALSVCFYEMLTGELPFKGPNFLAQKREGLYLAASGLVPGLPAGVDAFFKTALAPEPSKRYPTAASLCAAAEAAA